MSEKKKPVSTDALDHVFFSIDDWENVFGGEVEERELRREEADDLFEFDLKEAAEKAIEKR